MRMKRNPCIRRGGCYWVENLNAVGHEMMKTRPAVVVSCGALAGTSPVVNVVYLSNTDKEREGYVRVRTEKGLSVAHCENIYSVDKSRLGTYLGQCGEDEMEKIDAAILRSSGNRKRRRRWTPQRWSGTSTGGSMRACWTGCGWTGGRRHEVGRESGPDAGDLPGLWRGKPDAQGRGGPGNVHPPQGALPHGGV